MASAPSATPNPMQIASYNILQIAGFLAISCVTLTACFSRRIQRSPNWYMAMFMWMWWCIPYSFLMFSGHQLDVKQVPVPPRALCTIQAAFVYASPSALTVADFGILAQISSLVFETLYQKPGLSKQISRPLLYVPLVFYVTIFFISLSVGIDNPSKVNRSSTGAYCNIDHPLPSTVSSVASLIATVMILLLELFTFILLWKHRAWVKRMKTSSTPMPISLFIRVTCFSMGPITGSIFSAFSIGSNEAYQSPTVVLLTAAAPLLVAFVFGTQQDILSVWAFWKRTSPYKHNLSNKEAMSRA
ncbi:hypothetical protein DL96DRAFT_1585616 [Flagelloscypha sp. PMI_526]|nr:hypothetical protein DL96DRAFT_1585616 [Flagelloscypha sp. PMI_526]